ncbi:helix-turn-helix transcriptional regulator [Methylovirgula sp. 4M-Z18]|uniref:helix-turn-helix transcriptional regulator n=1 Tax=Methylovirgula sp. 4M-Z18 TaxID=2293567 RepID=UPI000E2F3529|nr:AraC family transcriptional regulator [Methylovirgula sp. 4M-Z18]RFB78480.1 AraC family transcriptional regulator [Methylovirgula sp. 4M-Z18]
MIENSISKEKHDRLFAFLRAFPLVARPCPTADAANLLIVAAGEGKGPTHAIYRPRAGIVVPAMPDARSLAASSLEFGGNKNPLVGVLPSEIVFALKDDPQLRVLAELIVAEEAVSQCGGGSVRARLSEIVVVYAIRRAIADKTVKAGLMAGLAHPELHPCLVAMHDDPARAWRIEDLTGIAGMTRGRFIRTFTETVGQSPGNYLTIWRLTLAQISLKAGKSVKVVAADVGFGSAAAFSRAFSRHFQISPSQFGASAEGIGLPAG